MAGTGMEIKKRTKRLIALMLSAILCMSAFSVTAVAEEEEPSEDNESDMIQGISEKESTDSVTTFTASDDGVEVQVTVPSDVLPDETELSLTVKDGEEEESERNEQTENSAQASDSFTFFAGGEEGTKSGTAILDISFMADGEEVEPTEPADVEIDASAFLEGREGQVESFEVWHIEETSEGENPVLVDEVSDPDEAAKGIAEFSVDSFSEFEFHYNCSASGWAGFGANLIDENGNTISATVTGYNSALTDGRYTTTVDMPYTFTIDEFVEHFTTDGAYAFQYATVTDPNYGDTAHTFDEWPGEEQVGAKELYGSKENPVVSVAIDGTAAAENPNYDPNNTGAVISKTWHFTLTYADDTSVTIPIYGNADGANDNGGKYCPKFLEINLYYETGKEAVLNLGNGNGTYSDGDYTGSKASGGAALRYGTGALNTYADENNKVTINLPSDDELNAGFTVADAVGTEGEAGYQPAITIALGKEEAYDYKLIGWINIATGKYYDVSNGATTAEIDLSDNNVFYADWIAASYDHGSSTDKNLREDTVSTSSFVKLRMFDYNELFDLYSVSLKQDGTEGETWTDSEKLYSEPLLGKTDLTSIGDSFIFQNNMTTRNAVHVLSHANPVRWNLWTKNVNWEGYDEYDFVLDAERYWNITSPDSTILGMLYDTNEESLGVHYVGEADNLFWVDENGYYTYDSAKSGAAYNQSEGRFYVYEYDDNDDNKKGFFPYNNHTDNIIIDTVDGNGITNYWFGMNMEVNIYVPSATSAGSKEKPVNQIDGKDMIFDFSGDDDIMIFIDDKMVVDMSGIHSTSYSRINFSTNTVTYSMGLDADGAPDTTGTTDVKYSVNDNLNLSAGNHTMKIFYMERGASASNLKIQFNVTNAWQYETGPVQTITAEKVWKDSEGNEITDTEKMSAVEVGLFDELGPASDDTYGYTRSGNTYMVEYTDDNGTTSTYVYDADGPTLTYTEVDSNGTIIVNGEKDDQIDSQGRVVDKDGYVVAWLKGETLYIRIDKQTLNNENDWTYAWELLDPDGSYEALELSESSRYTTSSTSEDLTSYLYWSVIGETEIEEILENGDGEKGPIILTEAAQEAESTLGDTKDAKGYVMVAYEDGNVKTEQVEFSQIATLTEVTENTGESTGQTKVGTYGVTSQSEINALGSGALWYMVDSRKQHSDVDGKMLEGFYLYCILDSQTYYLTLTEAGDGLTVTTDKYQASEFFYDLLGELLISITKDGIENTLRVEIDDEGNIKIDVAERDAELDDVRIYTLSETNTSGFAYMASNVFLPDVSLVKVDSETGDALAGATFTLQDADGKYYTFDEETDEVTWVEKPDDEESWETPTVATGTDGTVIFHYLKDGTYTLTEISAPDDYVTIKEEVTLTIVTDEDGKTTVTVSGSEHASVDDEDALKVRLTDDLASPKLTKEVAEDDYERKEESGQDMHDGEDTDGDGWGTWDDADNNQEVTYHLTLTDLEGVKDLTVHDYLEEGLDFESETVTVVLYDGTVTTELVQGTDYTETENGCSDPKGCAMNGCTFEVHFENTVFQDISDDAYLVITYCALTDTDANDYTDYEDDILNHSYLTYGTQSYRSSIVTTETDLFGFGVYKYAMEENVEVALSGAEFVLQKGGQYATFKRETDAHNVDYYLITGWTSDEASAGVLVSGDDGMIRIEGLDDDNYTLKETEAPIGYELLDQDISVVIGEYGSVTFEGGDGVSKDEAYTRVDVRNEPILIDIEGSKTWQDNDDQDGDRPTQIIVHLYANGEPALDANGDPITATVTASDGWSWKFTGLSEYKNGEKITYFVIEDTVPDYSADYTYEETDDGYQVIITNTHTPEETSLYVYKLWTDGDDQDGIRPNEITVHLLADGVQAQDADGNDCALTLSEGNDWSGSFTGLPVYRDQGVEIVYTISEDSIDGYAADIVSVDNADVVIIDNSHQPETVSVEGTKTWIDEDDQDGTRPAYITIRLYADGAEIDHVNVTEKEDWSWSFTDLPKYANGEEIVYTIQEDEVDGYEGTVNGYDVTNSHTPVEPEPETIDISGLKVWNDDNNSDGNRPDSITVRLFVGETEVASKEVSADDNWAWSFTGLDKFDENGDEIVYTVTEDKVDGYDSEITNIQDTDAYVIVNTPTPEEPEPEPEPEPDTEKIKIFGFKAWDDNDNADGVRPKSITVNLLKDGEVIQSVKVTAETYWIWSFSDLDKYDEDGNEIVYSISEDAVEGYDSDIEPIPDTDAYVIINTRTSEEPEPKQPEPGSEKMTVFGVKVWDDQDDADGMRPENITIYLLANDVVIDSVTVTADTYWIWSFTGLDKYDEEGNEIQYTVDEEGVKDYTSEIVGDQENGYKVTNTNTSSEQPKETRDITGTKTWDDDNDKADARPDFIIVNLYRNDELYARRTVTADDGWSYSWTGLPKYDEDGGKYTYNIDEVKVESYTPTYQKDSFDITNTFVGEEGAEPPTSGPERGGDTPKTGDTSHVWVWLALLAAALACGMIAFRMRKRG